MQEFEYGVRVNEGTGKQDKIELAVGTWWIAGLEGQVAYFLNLLGPEPYARAASSMEVVGASSAHSESLFNRHNGAQRPMVEMAVRRGGRGSVRQPGTPLFAGKLSAWREGAEDVRPGFGRRRLSLDLSINPTRYVAHQPLPGRDPYVHPGAWGAPSLRTRSIRLRTPHEASLDGKDNVLLGPRTRSFGRPEVWTVHLRRYWGGLLGLLGSEFQRAADIADVDLSGTPYLNLRSVETYWEFTAQDPTALICEMTPVLAALGIEASVREFSSYPDGLAQTDFTGNSRSITVLLSTGVKLRVYAKTTRRVRFEIQHKLMESAAALNGRHTTEPRPRHQRGNYDTLYEWLATLEADAAERLNGVLSVLERQQVRSASALRPYNLVHRVIRACPDERTAENMLSLLVNNRAIRIRPNDPLQPVVEALVQAQVLERLGNTRNPTRYVVTPQFRLAVADLRGERRRLHR